MNISAQGGLIYNEYGSSNYHVQYKGGLGSELRFLMPLGDHSTITETFRKKGLLQYNTAGNFIEFNNGTSWKRIADSAYVKTNYKPIAYVPDWSEITSKPTLFSGVYGDLTGKPTLFSGSYLDLTNKPTIPPLNTAGTGISITGGVIANTLPDQTVSLTGSNGISTGGTYPNFTISKKRQETYSGTTITAGTYTVTFGTAYSVAPNIQANIINGTDSQNIRTTSVSTTGFTVLVRNRVDVVGLLPTWGNVSGATVDVLITEK